MKNFIKAFIKITLSLVVLYYVFTKIDTGEVYSMIRSVNLLYLFVALVLFAISKVVSSFRLNIYFRALGLNLSEKRNLKLYVLGMYYNLFLPGGIGGDGYKVYILNKKFRIKIRELFWGVMIDRINGVYVLFILALMMVPFLPLGKEYSITALLLIPGTFLIYLMVHKFYFKSFYKVICKTTLLSAVVQLMQIGSAIFILFANDTFNDLTAYLFLFLISSIVATLPFTVGGIGSRELTFLYGAKLLNLDISLSIALSLLFYIITLVVSLVGVYYSLNTKSLDLNTEQQSDKHSNVSV